MRVLLVLLLIIVPGASGQEPCSGEADWRPVVQAHIARYPAMEPADLYKLLHQGATGSEHAVESRDAARQWMERELATLGEGPPEPVVDTIAPGGAHVRVHLRPFVAAGGDPEKLLMAFVRTANEAVAPVSRLRCALAAAVGLAEERQLPFDARALEAYFNHQRAAGYPAVHHSDRFAARYRPAYRVVSGALLASVGLESVP
jgi:hypothetical protein